MKAKMSTLFLDSYFNRAPNESFFLQSMAFQGTTTIMSSIKSTDPSNGQEKNNEEEGEEERKDEKIEKERKVEEDIDQSKQDHGAHRLNHNDSSESESICTVLHNSINPVTESRGGSSQKMFVNNLSNSNSDRNLSSPRVKRVDIELCEESSQFNQELQLQVGDITNITSNMRPQITNETFTPYYGNLEPNGSFNSLQRIRQHPSTSRGFSETQPRLCIASQRVKEYFESLKTRSQDESLRLYQFFKSTRTELVACMLLVIISTQTLIVTRNHLQRDKSSRVILSINDEYKSEKSSLFQHEKDPLVQVHLINGLVMSFTVASLTQVFGHISGCHLIPSISIALCVKGHISRARLASYLAAQSVGSLVGVCLMSLLTSSQITPSEYKDLVGMEMPYIRATVRNDSMSNFLTRSSRMRREIDDSVSLSDINLNDIQGSETILLSIMEQQQQHELKQQQARLDKRALEERTITVNVSTYQTAESSTVGSTIVRAPTQFKAISESQIDAHQWQVTGSHVAPAKVVPKPPPEWPSNVSNDNSQSQSSMLPVEATSNLPHPIEASIADRNGSNKPETLSAHVEKSHANGKRLKRVAKRRSKQEPSNGTNLSLNTEGNSNNLGDKEYYINLLEFALPDAIMSSDSIRQCIDRQQANESESANDINKNQLQRSPHNFAFRCFDQCLSLSNSSQMFVFQLLATLLVVLTYLVNVDPRRVDPGFKSLSIGLAYFVACVVTVQSGGFYGNPFHVLFLAWFSPIHVHWRTEWFIYFFTPLIGGLFGAASHEYIDFTSMRNRNKQLHLRRSFYSLESLRQPHNTATGQFGESEFVAPEVTTSKPESSQTEVRKLSSSCCSLDSSRSSVMTIAGQDDCQQASGLVGLCPSQGSNKRLVSYSKKVKSEQQKARRHQLHKQNHGASGNAARHSEYDSNFLISSLSPVAGPRHLANGLM